ncbi:MAG: hypothetical protein K2G99_00990, partial [Desulfovibrio sp.]|nr:hypothetical protein [Desulfovibrio sp.]
MSHAEKLWELLLPLGPYRRQGVYTAGALAGEGRALDGVLAAEGRLDGVLLVPPVAEWDMSSPADALAEACGAWCAGQGGKPWFAALSRWRLSPEAAAALLAGGGEAYTSVAGWMRVAEAAGAAPVLALLDDGRPLGRDALGDRLAAELFRGKGEAVLLALPARDDDAPVRLPAPLLLDRPALFAPVYPEPWAGEAPELPAESGLFEGGCQFSRFTEPALAEHGGWERPGVQPWLPFSRALLALLQGARLLLPWLTVTGFSDVRFFAPPALPPG